VGRRGNASGTPLAQTLGDFDHPRLVPEDGLRVPPREQRRIAVQRHRKGNADHGDTDLDDVLLQEILPDDREPLRGAQYTRTRTRRSRPERAGPAPRTAAALEARRKRTQAKVDQVRDTIVALQRQKTPVTVSAVVRRAGVSRTFLYKNPDAHKLISDAVGQSRAPAFASDVWLIM
jgi:hypothetical protein